MSEARPTITPFTNSYVTFAEAETYFTERAGAAVWHKVRPPEQMRFLITVSRLISNAAKDEFKLGTITTASTLLKQAVYELALSSVAKAAVMDQANTDNNVKIVKAGSVQIEFFNPVSGSRFPSVVNKLLVEAGILDTVAPTGAIVNGNDGCSVFGDNTSNNKTIGFF